MRRMFRAFETWINPFAAIPKQDLPDEIGPFILYFLRQTRWPFVVFMVLGGVVGLIEASLFYFVGLLIDTLKDATPASIWAEHGWMLLGMAFVVLVVRTLALTASTLINNQTLEPSFFALVRWQSHRRVLRQSYRFFQDDFAGRIATKVMQSGQSLGDFLINLIQSIWFFTVFSRTVPQGGSAFPCPQEISIESFILFTPVIQSCGRRRRYHWSSPRCFGTIS